jgi:pilus assembly protein Flp/PilA
VTYVRFVELGETWCGYQEVELVRIIFKFFADDSAATAIEYGLIAANISIAIIAAVNGIGATLNKKYSSVSTSLK